jgi:hypothetical protein
VKRLMCGAGCLNWARPVLRGAVPQFLKEEGPSTYQTSQDEGSMTLRECQERYTSFAYQRSFVDKT